MSPRGASSSRRAPPRAPARALARLAALRTDVARDALAEKRALLTVLDGASLAAPAQVHELHELLCFWRAYPGDRALLEQAERMLAGFAQRKDVRRHARALADTGIAGTAIHYRLFWPTARWLAHTVPDALSYDRAELDDEEPLQGALPLLAEPLTAEWLRKTHPPLDRALARFFGAPTDASAVVHAIARMPGDDVTRETFHDRIDAPYVITPGPGTPSRTAAYHARAPLVVTRRSAVAPRPRLDDELRRPPRKVRACGALEAHALIDLARSAMVTRARDLDAFAYGDPRDVRLVDDGGGLAFAMIGVVPERRPFLRTTYGFLGLRNRVPVCYAQADALLHTVDLSFNTFPTFRGAEAGLLFARFLAACHALLGARAFTVEPYQLGHGNDEGLASGAWWFYRKLGFAPTTKAARTLAAQEETRLARAPGRRSSTTTLRALAKDYLVYETGGAKAPSWPAIAALGGHVPARPLPVDDAVVVDAARRVCGRGPTRVSADVARAWRAFAPLVLSLEGVERWSEGEREALARVIDLKGGRRDDDYLMAFDAHPKLGAAIRALARSP